MKIIQLMFSLIANVTKTGAKILITSSIPIDKPRILATLLFCEVFFISTEYKEAISEFNIPKKKKISIIVTELLIKNANKKVKKDRNKFHPIYKCFVENLLISIGVINGVTNNQGIVSKINVRESNSDDPVTLKIIIGNATLCRMVPIVVIHLLISKRIELFFKRSLSFFEKC